MTKNKKIITYSSMAVCFLLIFIYCLSPWAVGINHNGSNIMFEEAVGLKGANDGYFYMGYNILDTSSENQNAMHQLVRPLVKLAGMVSDYFDIRILSFIYAVILLVSVFYLNKYVKFGNQTSDIIFAALTVFVAFDLSYLVYLNTLYAEGMFYVLFVFAVSLYVKLINSDKPQIPTTVIFMLTVVFLCGLVPNVLILLIPFGAMAGYLLYKRKDLVYRIVSGVLLIAMITYPVLSFKNDEKEDMNKFHSLFYGILYENNDANKAIKSFGIDEKYSVLSGKTYYDDIEFDINSIEFKDNVFDKITYPKILGYYITHPVQYFKQFKYVGWNAFETSPKYAGNFTISSGKNATDIAKGFNVFNMLKSKIFPKTLWFIYLIPILAVLLLIGYRKKIKFDYVFMGICLAVINIILFNVPMITGGLADIARTMAIYNISFDILLVMIVSLLVYTSAKKKQEFKEKYGLTQ